MKVIYLASGHAKIDIPGIDIIYQDKIVKRDLGGDMLEIDLSEYDLVLASPPCNWYSRALSFKRREGSEYANATKHLLPEIIKKCERLQIPVLIENVISKTRMKDILENTSLFYYEIGRHCYFSNYMFDFSLCPQEQDFKGRGIFINKGSHRQGGRNVNVVFKSFIEMFVTPGCNYQYEMEGE